MARAAANLRIRSPPQAQQLFCELLSALHDELADNRQTSEHWLEQTLQIMAKQYRDDLTREQLADCCASAAPTGGSP